MRYMKKFFKWAGYVLLSFIILLFVVLINWESVSYFTVKKIVQFYAGREHITFEIGAISGRPFSQTTLANVSIRPGEGQPQAYYFKARSIDCTYNLWDLKKGYELFLQGLICSADNPVFSYDFSITQLEDQPGGDTASFFVPAMLPLLELQNGSVSLSGSEWRAELSSLNGKLSSASAGHELQLEVGSFKFFQDETIKIDTGFSALLLYGDEKLTFDSFVIGEEEISATGFIDLSRIDKDYIPFGTDLSFSENLLNVSGLLEKKFLKLHTNTDNFDIGELQKRLGGTGWDISGKIRAEGDIAYNFENNKDLAGNFALRVQEGQVHGVGIESVSVVGSFDNRIFNVSSAEAKTPGNHILVSEVTVPMPLLQAGDIYPILGQSQAQFKIDLNDVGILLQLFKVDDDMLPEVVRPDALALNGHLQKGILYLAEGRAVTDESSLAIRQATIPIPTTIEALASVPVELAARLEISNLQGFANLFGNIPVRGEIGADINIKGRLREPETTLNLTGEYLSYEEKPLGSLALQGKIKILQQSLGKIKSLQFTVTELTQANDSGTLELLSPVTGAWQQDRFSMDAVFQIDGQGEIALGIRKIPGKDVEGEIVTRDIHSTGWLANFIDARYFFHGADIEAVLKGLPDSTVLELSGTVSEVGDTDVPFPLAGSFGLRYSSKGIEISEFTWKSHERNQLTLTGYLPYDPMASKPFLDGDIFLKGHIDFPALEDVGVFLEPWGISKGSVVLDLDVTGKWNLPEGHILVKAEGIEPPETLREYMDSAVDFSCDIAALGGSIVLQEASLDSSAYSAQATGSWRHGISVKELLQNRKVELEGEVAADATVKLKNFNFLRKNLPWIRRLEGDMQGELHLAGPITNPSLQGSFFLKDGELRHTFNFPMLSEVNLHGVFDEHSLTISNMQAEVGGSPVNLSGNVNKDKESIAVNLHVDGKNLLLFRNNDMRMRGDVQLDVSGPLEHLFIKGTTGMTGGYYTRNIDFLGKFGSSAVPVSEGVSFLFSFPDPPLKDATFDIKITTIEPFRIRNNLIRGILRPELSLKGTGELPFLVGTVYIGPSRVLLPSGRLQIQSGLIRFPAGEPDRPQLDLLANSKVLGYDINVVTQGPLDDPVITLSSSPSLPNDDLLLLLLTGQPPKEESVTSTGLGRGATNVMVYLGRDFLNKWLEDESGTSDETILDRFELDYGRAVTKSGEQTIESTFRLSEQTTEKKKVYYLSGEKDRYDAYNYGFKVVFRFE
jgi:hypothetical protein